MLPCNTDWLSFFDLEVDPSCEPDQDEYIASMEQLAIFVLSNQERLQVTEFGDEEIMRRSRLQETYPILSTNRWQWSKLMLKETRIEDDTAWFQFSGAGEPKTASALSVGAYEPE